MWYRKAKLYHGTNTETANYIKENGWDTDYRSDKGMSSSLPDKNFTHFTKTKQKADWYANDNLKNNDPETLKINFNGNLFKIPNKSLHHNDYGAWKYLSDFYNIPFVIKQDTRGDYSAFDIPSIIRKLNQEGYDGIEYTDKLGQGKSIMLHNFSNIS